MQYKGKVLVVCLVEVEASTAEEARELLSTLDAYELIGGIEASNVDGVEVKSVASGYDDLAIEAATARQEYADAAHDLSANDWEDLNQLQADDEEDVDEGLL